MRDKGIRANCVLPGLMNTPMIYEPLKDFYSKGDIEEMIRIRDGICPMKKMGDAWDVAHACLFLASDEAKYITGAELVVDGGISCSMHKALQAWVIRRTSGYGSGSYGREVKCPIQGTVGGGYDGLKIEE